MNSCILSVSILILCLHLCYALECYTCSGQTGVSSDLNDCEYFSNNSYESHKKSSCSSGDDVCAKYTVNHDGMTWVHRACKPYDICNYLNTKYSNGRDYLMECTICSDRNLCNSSISISGATFLMVTMLFSLFASNFILDTILSLSY